jgi:hypothetical protein
MIAQNVGAFPASVPVARVVDRIVNKTLDANDTVAEIEHQSEQNSAVMGTIITVLLAAFLLGII